MKIRIVFIIFVFISASNAELQQESDEYHHSFFRIKREIIQDPKLSHSWIVAIATYKVRDIYGRRGQREDWTWCVGTVVDINNGMADIATTASCASQYMYLSQEESLQAIYIGDERTTIERSNIIMHAMYNPRDKSGQHNLAIIKVNLPDSVMGYLIKPISLSIDHPKESPRYVLRLELDERTGEIKNLLREKVNPEDTIFDDSLPNWRFMPDMFSSDEDSDNDAEDGSPYYYMDTNGNPVLYGIKAYNYGLDEEEEEYEKYNAGYVYVPYYLTEGVDGKLYIDLNKA